MTLSIRLFFSCLLCFPFMVFGQDRPDKGDSCSTVQDLSAGLGPVRNQADTSWCYAFTAADLMSQKLQGEGALKPGERIHPFQVAGVYHLSENKNPNQSTYSIGSVVSAFEKMPGKLCRDTDLDAGEVFKKAESQSAEVFRRGFSAPSSKPCTGNGSAKELANLQQSVNEAAVKSWRDDLNKACQVPSGRFIFENYFDRNRDRQLVSGGPSQPDPAVDAKLKENLDLALGKGRMAAIAYQPDFLLNRPIKGMHWSSVVGRTRAANGTCFYRIRNSWGSDCSVYKDQRNCKNGYIWVPESELLKNSSNVVSIR